MRYWQLFAAACWLIIAALLYFRDSLLSEKALEKMQGRNWTVATWVALFLFAWNLARWYHTYITLGRSARRGPTPLQAERPRDQPYEYNPELDFQKSDPSRRDA